MPINHIAISPDDISECCSKSNADASQCFKEYFSRLSRLLNAQLDFNIPIFTIYLLPEGAEKNEHFAALCDFMSEFFEDLCNANGILRQKTKISVFGKWYNLPSRLIESLKKAIDETKENNSFFVNFCINYDGQEEIVDACKLIAKQIELGKLDPEMVTKETIKENIYSSYFLPPDAYLIYGDKRWDGLLLWDSVRSKIIFAGKPFIEFEEDDIKRL